MLIIIYAAYLFCRIDSIGVFTDEAYDGVLSLQILGKCSDGLAWPFGIGHYHGALQSYLAVPFFLVIKNPLLALRCFEISTGIFVLAATYFCLRDYFGRITALITLVFLVVNPAFIFMSQIGIMMGFVMNGISMIILMALRRWLRGAGIGWFLAACFLAGAGASIRIWFFWFIVFLVMAGAFCRKKLSARVGLGGWRTYIFSGLSAFAVGSLLLILHELTSEFNGVENVFTALSERLWVRGDFFSCLIERLQQFASILSGDLRFSGLDWYARQGWRLDFEMGHIPPWALRSGFQMIFYLVCCVYILSRANTKTNNRRKILLFAAPPVVMLLLSSVSPSTLNVDHLILILPFPQVLMALAMVRAWRHGGTAKIILPLMGSISLMLCSVSWLHEHNEIEKTGGVGLNSDAIFELTEWLESRGVDRVVGEWGTHHAVQLLSNCTITPKVCQFENSGIDCLRPTEHYLFLGPNYSSNAVNFSSAAVTGGRSIEESIFFREKNGTIAYVVVRLGSKN